jgi:menaquinone-dependent protoporphyrinogen IX oxidase
VIIGSAIRSEKWLPQAMRFVSANKEVLSKVPTAYFLTCLTLANPSEKAHQKARSFLDPVLEMLPEVKPACIGLFPGVLDYSKYSTGMGAVMHYKMWAEASKRAITATGPGSSISAANSNPDWLTRNRGDRVRGISS